MTTRKFSRRDFMTNAAIAGVGLTIVPRHVLGRGFTAPSDLLNVAAVGVGGQGRANLVNLASENVVALNGVSGRPCASMRGVVRSSRSCWLRMSPSSEANALLA